MGSYGPHRSTQRVEKKKKKLSLHNNDQKQLKNKQIVRLRKIYKINKNEELEALFYVALLILTLITLVLALILRESPQF